jgi:hypothetical protein
MFLSEVISKTVERCGASVGETIADTLFLIAENTNP